MKKNVFIIMVVLFMGTQLYAQEANCKFCKKQDRVEQKTEIMAQKLGLDNEQKIKVLELNQKFDSQLQSAVCNENTKETKTCCKEKEQKKDNCCNKNTENKSNCCKENQKEKTNKYEMPHNEQLQKVCPKKMKRLNEEYMKELQTILNTEQLSKLKNSCNDSQCIQNKPKDNNLYDK